MAIPKGKATSVTRRTRAGTIRPYPKTCSCSHHSRRREIRPDRGIPAASRMRGPTATGASADLELPLDGEGDLLLRPVHGALGRHAVNGLGDHVGQDVVVVDALHGLVGLGRPAAWVGVLGLL